ncbi:glycoside hydrolase family 9 protein [Schizophyllum amplum]|uniref:Endoglucanase n=1 Tax=Schizophyllum amplum TaxID=97359 RepID=A0A550CT21_9AGAR|nr:glycoside hydrolase family 9 protein [Auriculariopsis ampla]
MIRALSFCILLSSYTAAQLSLPDPPFLPPNASAGTVPSNSSARSPNAQWSTLLGDLLYFYDAQRSGDLPDTNRVDWRNDSALDDGDDVEIDLTGGYYDAGDYIKASFPLSFSLMSICWGALDFGRGYELANQTAYLDGMLRWGLDWLIKAHASDDTLYVLVGDADTDNAYWGGDENIPTPRLSYQVNASHPGTDAFAGASAAFSACSSLYANRTFGSTGPLSLHNSTYSKTLLSHATQLYDVAVHASGGQQVYQESVPEVADAYGSSSYEDELTIAALFLSWAKDDDSLFDEAEDYYDEFSLSDDLRGVFNWDSKAAGLPILFAQVSNATGHGDATYWQGQAENLLDGIIDNDNGATLTGGGLLYYDGDSDSCSLNPALNAAMLLTKYAPLTSDDQRQKYTEYSDKQLNYTLGDNPMSVPYVIGINPNAPQNPHSALASGGTDIGRIDDSPEKEAYILYGALVGGPDKSDKFFDVRRDWPQTEVALDYNAPLLTLAAYHVLTDEDDPFYVTLEEGAANAHRPKGAPCDAAIDDGCNLPGMSRRGIIAMAVCVGVTGLVVLALFATWFYLAWTR